MKELKTYVFDLDGTICFPNLDAPDTHTRYRMAKPNPRVIAFMRWCYEHGDRLIIHTARRMLTHKGDVDKIIEDVGQVTIDWLKEQKVPYHELVFGKPYGDYYIDDKAVNANEI